MTLGDLDKATDPQVAALLTLGRGGVNADLAEVLGGDVLAGVYPCPATLAVMSAVKLPALMIWRRQEELSRKGRALRYADREVELRIECVLPATPKDRLPSRWPLLQAVWWQLLRGLFAGRHDAVSGGAEILRAAGIHTLEVEEARVTYSFAAETQSPELFPYFQATLPMVYREPPDLSDLHDLLATDVRYLLTGESPPLADDEPILRQHVPLHGSIDESENE